LKRLAEQRRQPAATETPTPKAEGGKPKAASTESATPGASKKPPKAPPADDVPATTEGADAAPKKPRTKKSVSPPAST
ncbi:MAG: hypothetical protein WCB19_01295, partial [Thermoplasmata archaeon]